MPSHKTGTREEWLEARKELLAKEKDLTRRGDQLATERRDLPWVPIGKQYRFSTAEGQKTLAELFDGRSQLMIYHFMFGPGFTAGCPACSSIADGFNGFTQHLAGHDVTLCVVSRAPYAKLQAYQERMGWSFPWASSYGSDFSSDFQTAYTDDQLRSGTGEYNYREFDLRAAMDAGKQRPFAEWAATCGVDWATYTQEAPGMSSFAFEDGTVYHTYSAYARGLDALWGMYQWLDRAPRGRNEARSGDDPLNWFLRHDEYGTQ